MSIGRCVALESSGKRCRKSATHWDAYHGDSELYYWGDGKPGWVRVALCEQHRVSDKPKRNLWKARSRDERSEQ